MAITQVGSTVSNGVNSGLDITLTLPSMVEGDVVILIGGTSNAHATPTPTIVGPSTPGYTEILVDHTDNDPTAAEDWCMFGAWYKVMGATPDTTVTGQGNGLGTCATAYHAIVLRGVDPAAVVDGVSVFSRPGGAGEPDPPAVTVTTADAWVFACAAVPNAEAAVTAPSGYTGLSWAVGNDTNDIACGFAHRVVGAAVTEDPAAFTDIAAPIELNPGAFTFAVRPAGAGGGAVDIAAADSAHAHAAESPTITQTHATTPTDSLHGHTVGAATLTQVHVLAPTDSGHAHAVESPTLSQVGDLDPAAATHGHASEQPTLTQTHALTPADGTHGHDATSPTLATGTTLLPAPSGHRHATGHPTVTQLHLLDPARTTHAHAADLAALTQAHQLAALNSIHPHTTGTPALATFEPSGNTPDSRTLVVSAEARSLAVPVESRTLVVPAEERITSIPPEPRTTTA